MLTTDEFIRRMNGLNYIVKKNGDTNNELAVVEKNGLGLCVGTVRTDQRYLLDTNFKQHQPTLEAFKLMFEYSSTPVDQRESDKYSKVHKLELENIKLQAQADEYKEILEHIVDTLEDNGFVASKGK